MPHWNTEGQPGRQPRDTCSWFTPVTWALPASAAQCRICKVLTFEELTLVPARPPAQGGTIITPILWMNKPRLRDWKRLLRVRGRLIGPLAEHFPGTQQLLRGQSHRGPGSFGGWWEAGWGSWPTQALINGGSSAGECAGLETLPLLNS